MFKRTVLLFLSVMAFYSCTKTTDPVPNTTSRVTSYKIYNAFTNTLGQDTFRYDQSNNVGSISYKGTNDIGPYETIDSGTFYFTTNGSTHLPSEYTLIGRKYFYTADLTENHVLSYDDQNRLILDSMISSSSAGYNPYGAHYLYTSDAVVIHTYHATESDFTQQDSILLNTGNFVYYAESFLSGSVWAPEFSYAMTANSGYANPFYDEALSKSLGGFFIRNNLNDFISKNLTYPAGYSFTWTTDDKARVVSGTATDGSYVLFTYQ
jgi:hypothetical protein